jgi:hypothetical protein
MRIKKRSEFGMMSPVEKQRLVDALMANATVTLFIAVSEPEIRRIARCKQERVIN